MLSDESLMLQRVLSIVTTISDRGLPIRKYDGMDAWNDACIDAWNTDGSPV